jgi:hypothetical protein
MRLETGVEGRECLGRHFPAQKHANLSLTGARARTREAEPGENWQEFAPLFGLSDTDILMGAECSAMFLPILIVGKAGSSTHGQLLAIGPILGKRRLPRFDMSTMLHYA